MFGRQRGIVKQLGEADHAVDGRADLVADDGEEFALGAVGGFGGFLGGDQGKFGLLARGDIVADGLVFDDPSLGILDGAVSPGVKDCGVVGIRGRVFENGGLGQCARVEFKKVGAEQEAGLTDQLESFTAEETGVGAIYKGEFGFGGVATDEVGLIFDYGAITGFELLQGLGHALDLAGETDDFVVDFVVVGFGGAGRRAGHVPQALHHRAIPDIAA